MPGESNGQRSLADYNPGGHTESDTSEHNGEGFVPLPVSSRARPRPLHLSPLLTAPHRAFCAAEHSSWDVRREGTAVFPSPGARLCVWDVLISDEKAEAGGAQGTHPGWHWALLRRSPAPRFPDQLRQLPRPGAWAPACYQPPGGLLGSRDSALTCSPSSDPSLYCLI